jgi:hypothetical protein
VDYFLQRLGTNGTGTAITITVYLHMFNQLTDAEKQIAVDKNYILAGTL